MNDSDIEKLLEFMDTFIKDDIITKIKMFHRGGWSFSSQKIHHEYKNRDILSSSSIITCVEFQRSVPELKTIRVDISLKITNPELLSELMNKKNTPQEISNLIKITFKRTDDPDYKEEAYTYNRESFFDNIGRFILSASKI